MGQVLEVGSQVQTVKVGDWVIPRDAGLGKSLDFNVGLVSLIGFFIIIIIILFLIVKFLCRHMEDRCCLQ